MPIEKQRELRQKLAPYKFDVAIDLSDSGVSRPLLYLSGAPFRYGFRSGEFPWLSAGFDGGTRDIVNGLEQVPHGNKIMGLIEWFGVLLKSHATIERREDLTRDMLVSLGLQTDSRFVVLHTGARLVHSRWPYYHELAALILARTGLSVVVMVDDPKEKTNFGPDLVNSGRFLFIDKRPTFDQFDALLSFCEAFVGNDSGPKHLAALRGANVVSIHMARNNWNEWGQENNGLIISRRVPCAGCCIHHEPEECGKGFACIVNILPQEVYKAIESLWETTSQLKN